MSELPLEYLNQLSRQMLFISALLGGFSLTVVVMLMQNKDMGRLMMNLFRLAIVSTGSFLLAIFSFTRIIILTTEGCPLPLPSRDFNMPRTVGSLCFLLGILAVILILVLAGWTKSKKMGWFTTVIGIVMLLGIFTMMS